MNHQQLFYLVALKLTTGVGDVLARNLIGYSRGLEEVFKLNKKSLLKIPGVGSALADNIVNQASFETAAKEVEFIIKNNIAVISYFDKHYPHRMKHHNNLPFLLFAKGTPNLNPERTLAIVGTRRCTEYGKEITKSIVKDLTGIKGLSIVSGLAYGIDKVAHQAAVESGIPTVGALGHGLQTVYPAQNQKLADQMVVQEGGGLLSQFCSNEAFLPANFPKRNEIIAGMADAVLVIETDIKGGSKITAELAFDMNRDVLAIPGRVGDKVSRGCHQLIKYHKAALVENAKDIKRIMNWDELGEKAAPQAQLFVELSETEESLLTIMRKEPEWQIDKLSAASTLTPSALSATLLSLEMKGVVQSLPGKVYKILNNTSYAKLKN